MTAWTVMERPYSAARDADAVLVPEGFALGALLCGPLWALWHAAGLVAAGLLAVELALFVGAALLGVTPDASAAAGLAWRVALGLAGSELRRMALAARGWRERATVDASSLDEAERRWLSTPPGTAR
ncbi:MAG: DUF2628 domain-containing protein [Alphaproteobacteria bacterium]|nr:DUF2628 domain-containing protein [Alphaproteobacteria bacterium]